VEKTLKQRIEELEKKMAELSEAVQPEKEEVSNAILNHLYRINLWTQAVACYYLPDEIIQELAKSLKEVEFEQSHLAYNGKQEKHLHDNQQ
jgi:hypothetical protein